jgi:hypothetical protein
MRKLFNAGMLIGVRVLIAVLFALANLLVPSARAAGGCGCMDIVLVVDNTGSMYGAIDNVKAELPNIIEAASAASCGDLRMGLVTFPEDNVIVNQPLTADITAVQNAVRNILLGGGAGEAESSDEALQYVVTGAADPSCTVSNGPFGTFRPGCVKIVVLITDAHPAGCDDTFTNGVDDVHAHNVALAAANAGILVSAIYVPTYGEMPDIKAIMQDYATTSGGVFVEAASNGTGTGSGITDIIALICGGLGSHECITRPARFWLTHPFGTELGTDCYGPCVNLLDAIRINGNVLNLGFITSPTTYYTGSSLTSTDALIEALGVYWRSTSRTGDDNGLQNAKLSASLLCRARKLLATEWIAAIANVKLLGAAPSNCTYVTGSTMTNFPADLLSRASAVAAGEDVAACLAMRDLLQKFNLSGITNSFPSDLYECSAWRNSALKELSRDPTTKLSCPGKNDECETAEAVTFTLNPKTLMTDPFKRSVNTSAYGVSSVGDITSSNAVSGHLVWYKIETDVGRPGRQFTANTAGSNFDTMLTVWQGTCNSVSNLLSMVALNDNNGVSPQARVQFSTDGTNTYYIVVGPGGSGGYGKAKINVTSP